MLFKVCDERSRRKSFSPQAYRCISSVRYVMRSNVRDTRTHRWCTCYCVCACIKCTRLLSSISGARQKPRIYLTRFSRIFFVCLFFFSLRLFFLRLWLTTYVFFINIVSPSRMLQWMDWLVGFVGRHFQCTRKWDDNQLTAIDGTHKHTRMMRRLPFRFISFYYDYFLMFYAISLSLPLSFAWAKNPSALSPGSKDDRYNTLLFYMLFYYSVLNYLQNEMWVLSLYLYDAHTKQKRKSKNKL